MDAVMTALGAGLGGVGGVVPRVNARENAEKTLGKREELMGASPRLPHPPDVCAGCRQAIGDALTPQPQYDGADRGGVAEAFQMTTEPHDLACLWCGARFTAQPSYYIMPNG